MKKTAIATLALLAAMPIFAFAEEMKVNGECTLSYKGRIYAQGPCEMTVIDKKVTDLKGTVAENGLNYTAIINESEHTGLLLGAGTFVLADGELDRSPAAALYAWPNGYAVDAKFTLDK